MMIKLVRKKRKDKSMILLLRNSVLNVTHYRELEEFYSLFEKIGIDKIKSIKNYSANSIDHC